MAVQKTLFSFSDPLPGSREALFNSAMSPERESVEWPFGRLKVFWPTLVYARNKSQRIS